MMKEYMVIMEHERNKRKWAKEFRALSLKRTSLRAILKYVTLYRHKNEQLRSIKVFYEAKLKSKLLKFLHQSNIEFIEHSVHIEQFLQRRKKMRNVLRVLHKNARVEASTSCFTKLPTP